VELDKREAADDGQSQNDDCGEDGPPHANLCYFLHNKNPSSKFNVQAAMLILTLNLEPATLNLLCLHSCAVVELLQIARRHHLVALHARENLYPAVLFIANL